MRASERETAFAFTAAVRTLLAACLAALGMLLAAAPSSSARAVTPADAAGAVGAVPLDLPTADPLAGVPDAQDIPGIPSIDARARSSHSTRRASPSRAVLRSLKRLQTSGAISADQAKSYRGAYKRAIKALARMTGQRRTELAGVLSNLETIATARDLTAPRAAIVFQILDRNRTFWSQATQMPTSGQRFSFQPSQVIWQYYPGQGVQPQPLASFGRANGLFTGGQMAQFKSLVDEMVGLAIVRSGYATWEYYFTWENGRPPWVSGITQGAALQALSRAGSQFGDQSYVDLANSARGIFKKRSPRGVRKPMRGGAWYLIYSFAPSQLVLNAFLESLIGLYELNARFPSSLTQQLYARGNSVAQRMLAAFDTGAWALYQAGGAEANLNYMELTTTFLQNLCSMTSDPAYCDYASLFGGYLKEPPVLSAVKIPGSRQAGRATTARFTLSKVSNVTLTLRNAGGAAVVTQSGQIPYGRRKLNFTAPTAPGTYTWSLTATDLAGNRADPVAGVLDVP